MVALATHHRLKPLRALLADTVRNFNPEHLDLLDDLAPSGAAAVDVLDEVGEGLEFALNAVRHALGIRLDHRPGDIDARCQGAALGELLV